MDNGEEKNEGETNNESENERAQFLRNLAMLSNFGPQGNLRILGECATCSQLVFGRKKRAREVSGPAVVEPVVGEEKKMAKSNEEKGNSSVANVTAQLSKSIDSPKAGPSGTSPKIAAQPVKNRKRRAVENLHTISKKKQRKNRNRRKKELIMVQSILRKLYNRDKTSSDGD